MFMNRSRGACRTTYGFFLIVFLLTISSAACTSDEPTSEAIAPPFAEPTKIHHEDQAQDHDDAHNNDAEETFVQLTEEAASHAAIQTEKVASRVLAGELSTTGQVGYDETRLAHVSPRISGRVHSVNAGLGQKARSGQTLARVDSMELGHARSAYLQAKAKAELASTSHDRAVELFAQQIVAQQEVLVAQAELREASAGLHAAAETLRLFGLEQQHIEALAYEAQEPSLYALRAPFDGTVVESHAILGELVTPETTLFRLADLSRMWIWIDVHQQDLGRVHVDDQARARVDAFPDHEFAGIISFLSAEVDADTRTVRARLDVANPEGHLRPGMFVDVELMDPHSQAGDEAQERLVISESAVVRDGDRSFVFVARGERRFQRHEIQIGRRAGGFVEVMAGLEAGSEVVVEGAFLLKSAASKESLGGGHAH